VGVQGNVGLIFIKGDLKEVSEEVAKYKVFLSYFDFCKFSLWKSFILELLMFNLITTLLYNSVGIMG